MKATYQTPPEVADVGRQVLGGRIELDPCSTLAANMTIRAARFYEHPGQNGLAEDWTADTLWMNPPFTRGEIDLWIARLKFEAIGQRVGAFCTIVPARLNGQGWAQEIQRIATFCCFPAGRVNYIDPSTGKKAHGANFDSVILAGGTLLDRRIARQALARFGVVWRR